MTCLETYASLRVFSDSVLPENITKRLDITPAKSLPSDPVSKYRHRREHHYWDWESKVVVQSQDGIAHVRAIIEVLRGKEAILDQLREDGCEVDVCCYWVSSGQGGPSLDLDVLTDLARLGLPIWWDVYFGDPDDYKVGVPEGVAG